VGYFNHKFFLIFCFDLTVGGLYGLIVTYYAFRQCNVTETPADFCGAMGRTKYTYLVGMVCSIPITMLFAFQLHMVLTNDTTVEYFTEVLATSAVLPRERTDFGPHQNWIEHFGDATLLGVCRNLLLPCGLPPLGDGISFQPERSPAARSHVACEVGLIGTVVLFGHLCVASALNEVWGIMWQ